MHYGNIEVELGMQIPLGDEQQYLHKKELYGKYLPVHSEH